MFNNRAILPFIILALVLAGVYVVVILAPEPPIEKLKQTHKLLAEARDNGSSQYENDLFKLSEEAYQNALQFMETENKRFFLFRDYSKCDSCCDLAVKYATQARLGTENKVQVLENELKKRLQKLSETVESNAALMKDIPVSKEVRQQYAQGKMKLSEAYEYYQSERLLDGKKNLDLAENMINQSVGKTNQLLSNYFRHYPNWLKGYDKSIQKSKKAGTYLIVVDKMARTCEVYKAGKMIKRFPVELGSNWMGDKQKSGDKTTPEGSYLVKKKLDGRETRYFKALLLNYPNEEDQARFNQNMKNGHLPKNASIGGLIEIHGHGGKGVDWTDGCIALKDRDMNELYKLIPVSTPVLIVGSLVPLEKTLYAGHVKN